MATINLFLDSGGVNDHVHIEEDLTSQSDGSKLVFKTSFSYEPGSLLVVYNGVTYTKDNDFTETDQDEFTLVSDDPFPPESTCPLVVTYRKLTL